MADDTANWNTDEALALVETWLTQYPDVGGIWCANDNMATGALQALDAAGLKGKVGVCGIDANTDIVEAIANGEATATVSSNGYLQGGYTLAIWLRGLGRPAGPRRAARRLPRVCHPHCAD